MLLRTAFAASVLASFALIGPPTTEQAPEALAAGPGDVLAQEPAIVLGQPFKLKFGETAQLTDDPLRITFDKVVEDSRCPVKVQCVWAGRVVVGLTAALPDGPSAGLNLQLGASKGAIGYNVVLSKVEPAKTEDSPPDEDSYVLTLTVHPAE